MTDRSILRVSKEAEVYQISLHHKQKKKAYFLVRMPVETMNAEIEELSTVKHKLVEGMKNCNTLLTSLMLDSNVFVVTHSH